MDPAQRRTDGSMTWPAAFALSVLLVCVTAVVLAVIL